MSSMAASPGARPKKAAASKPASKKVAHVTPSSNHRLQVDKNIVDELLLVCGVIGTSVETDEKGRERLVPVTDCLNWLQDLQRALRRDDDLYRPISLLLGQWKVVQQKLLPLVWSCRYDTPLVLTVVKILVILTKPLAENTVRAGLMVIDTSGKVPEAVVQEQIKLRENALAQADMRMEYKRAVCRHASHLGPKKEEQGGLLSIFVSLLAEPLSRTGTSRTDQDHLTIELVLHLFRNLLSAEPLLTSSVESHQKAITLHKDLVALYDRELVLEIFLVLGADMEQRENLPYNLLLMELLHHLLRHEDPTAVARSALKTAGKENPSQAAVKASSTGLLKGQLQREKQSFGAIASTRHSHFGGTLLVQRPSGKRQYVSTAQLLPGHNSQAAGAPAKRKNKRTDPFIGNGRTKQSHTRGLLETGEGGPTAVRAQQALHRFCRRFVQDCYGPVMKSLKNEFRRDSVRLEDGDRVVFFRLAWFFCQWWRVSGKKVVASKNDKTPSQSALGQLIFTMDVFTFNLVLNATDTFVEHKKHARLAQTVALLSEMLHLLHVMYTSKESTEQLMAMGLMDRLFYGSDPLDRLPRLLSKWTPGTSTREYLCDLVEVTHMTLKMLEAHAKACTEMDVKEAKHDTVAKMKAAAADFDISAYFCRKIVSNHVVYMYTQLLSQYAVNAPHVNHRIVAFFLRLSKFTIVSAETNDPEMPQNLLATKTVTLEPMLYNVQLLSVLNSILNDTSIRKDKDYTSVLSFAAGLVHNFAKAAQANPMMFVEAMCRHPVPHRFCELTTNMYVNEELKMIAERELLLEDQQRLEEHLAAQQRDQEDEDEEEDEELEFEDFGITAAMTSMKKQKRSSKRTKKATERDAEDDDDDDAGDKGNNGERKITAKRKSSILEDSDDDSDGEMAARTKQAAIRTAEIHKRLRKLDANEHESSSDDDDVGFDRDNKASTDGASNPKNSRLIIDDDE